MILHDDSSSELNYLCFMAHDLALYIDSRAYVLTSQHISKWYHQTDHVNLCLNTLSFISVNGVNCALDI